MGVQETAAGSANWIFGSCLSGFINQNNGGISAVATAFLTIITGLLAWLTSLQMRNSRKQMRAYVFADSISLYDGTTVTPTNPQKVNVPGTVLIFKNSGQSPAKSLISWAKIDVIEPRHESTLVINPLKKLFSLSLGASGTFPKLSEFGRALNAQEITDIGADTKRIYLYGRIEYLDIFGDPHFTNFRYYYSGAYPPPAGSTFKTTENGNDFD